MTVLETAPRELQDALRGKDEIGQSRAFRESALIDIHSHPLVFVGRWIRKCVIFWAFGPVSGLSYPRWYFHLYFAYYVSVLTLAAIGAVCCVRQRWARSGAFPGFAAILAAMLSVAIVQSAFYVELRHRWGVEPLILVLAAIGTLQLWASSRHVPAAATTGGARRPSVMMVTGAYYPELSGAGLQCRTIIRGCGDAARFSVLTTAVDPKLPRDDEVDGVPVRRVLVSARNRLARWSKTAQLVWACIKLARQADIVHLHGFYAKSLVAVVAAKLLRKKIVVTLTSVGHDDPVSMRAKGAILFQSFGAADRFIGLSPRFRELYDDLGLPGVKYRAIPCGVDLDRFRPASPDERDVLRRELGLPVDLPLIVFVGFFSHEKCPDLLFDAWTDTFATAPPSGLVLIGATRSDYYEIDAKITDRIRSDAARLGCTERLTMVERTLTIEKYYRAADMFVLPSRREGLPNAVLEAMASGLPCLVSRLRGNRHADHRRGRRAAGRARRSKRPRADARYAPRRPASARAPRYRCAADRRGSLLARRDGSRSRRTVSRADRRDSTETVRIEPCAGSPER